MQILVAILVPLGGMVTVAFIVYILRKAEKQERIALIESGKDAGIFQEGKGMRMLNNLKNGMVFIGIGVGLLVANLLSNANIIDSPFAYFAMTPICAGIALVLFYSLKKDEWEAQ